MDSGPRGLLNGPRPEPGDSSKLIAQLREALAESMRTCRALEIQAERQRQQLRAYEAAVSDGTLSPNREASLLQQIAELTETVAEWQGKYGRLLRGIAQ